MSGTHQPKGPPYLPQTWSIGGRPELKVDVPVTAVFLLLFIGGAAFHMTLFRINHARGHKFLFSAAIFGFCMARIVTCIMRIASTSLPHDISLAIAAQIFTAAGVVIMYIVNLFFVERIIRATHPRLGWNPIFSNFFKFLYALVIASIIMLITVVVQSFYTLNPNIHRIDHDIMLYGVTTFAVLSFLPIPFTIGTLLIPRDHALDKFGSGRWRHKAPILLTGTALISFGACYRAGLAWLPAVPQTQPLPSVMGKGPFYVVNFTVEILTIYLYAFARVDQRFHVPDNARMHENYGKAAEHNARIMNGSGEVDRATSQDGTEASIDVEKEAGSRGVSRDHEKRNIGGEQAV